MQFAILLHKDVNGNIPCGHLKRKKTCRSFDANRRSVYAIYRIGSGHQGLERFLILMIHPPPVHEKITEELGINYVME